MTAPYIVVVGGGTASGKTTVARAVADARQGLLISHDRYYLDVAEPVGHNYDHPDSLDTDRLVEDLRALAQGRATELPVYDFRTHSRLPAVDRVEPGALIIVEGILTLADPRVVQLAHLTVYVDAPDDLRLVRRLQRDVVQRGREVGGVLTQYLQTVRPMHERFVAPCKHIATLVLDGTAPRKQLQAQLHAAIDAGQAAR